MQLGVDAARPAPGEVRAYRGLPGGGELAVEELRDVAGEPAVAADHEPETRPANAAIPGNRAGGPTGFPGVEQTSPRSGVRDAAGEAFTRLVVPEIEVLLRVATALTGNVADAEDLVQDTLLRAYRAIGVFDGAHPRAWLLTILRHTHVNRNRRRRPGLLRDPDIALRLLEGTQPDPAPTPEEVVVGAAFDTVVGAAFAALPSGFQQVVWLIDVEGFSYADTAALLGVPRGTVMSRLHRARTRIRVRLVAAGLAPRRGRK